MGIGPWGLMLALAGIILLIAALAQAVQNRSYAACSEKAAATVTHKTSRKTKNGRSYELLVAYEVNEIAYEKWIGVRAEDFNVVNTGDPFEILYKPQNPKHAVSPASIRPRNVRTVLIIGAALTAVGIALFMLR